MDDVNGAVALARTWVARYREKHPGPGPFDPEFGDLHRDAEMDREFKTVGAERMEVAFVGAVVLIGRWLRGDRTPVPEQEAPRG